MSPLGFQARVGSLIRIGVHVTHFLIFTSGATPADFLALVGLEWETSHSLSERSTD